MAYKEYSDAEVSEAMIRLAVNKYDYAKTAQELGGVTERTLRNWEKDFPKKGVPDLLERALERILSNIPTEGWKGTDWAITLGILMDKYLLIKGEPTSRVESILKRLGDLPDTELDELERQFTDAASRPRTDQG